MAEDARDDETFSLLHQGRNILAHVVVRYNRVTCQYDVVADAGGPTEQVIDRADTRIMALRLGDVYLLGYAVGYHVARELPPSAHPEEEQDEQDEPDLHHLTRAAVTRFGIDSRRN